MISFETKMDANNEFHHNNYLFQVSHIFNENIDRVWPFLKDLKYDQTLIVDPSVKIKYIKGNDSFKIGNKFSYRMIGFMKMLFECINKKFEGMKKEISWNVTSDINISFKMTYHLYKVSAGNQTLAKTVISRLPFVLPKEITIGSSKPYYKEIHYKKLVNYDKYISESSNNMINYESCVINLNYKEIWKIVTNLKILNEITSLIGENVKCLGNHLKVGAFWKFMKDNNVAYVKVIKVEMPKKKNSWTYCLETIGTNESIIKYELHLKLIKINNTKTHFSIEQIFKQNIKADYLKLKSQNKKEMLDKLKKYCENEMFDKINDNKNIINVNKWNNSNISNVNNVTSSNTNDINYNNSEINENNKGNVEIINKKNNSI